jgi:hypothetical protein
VTDLVTQPVGLALRGTREHLDLAAGGLDLRLERALTLVEGGRAARDLLVGLRRPGGQRLLRLVPALFSASALASTRALDSERPERMSGRLVLGQPRQPLRRAKPRCGDLLAARALGPALGRRGALFGDAAGLLVSAVEVRSVATTASRSSMYSSTSIGRSRG